MGSVPELIAARVFITAISRLPTDQGDPRKPARKQATKAAPDASDARAPVHATACAQLPRVNSSVRPIDSLPIGEHSDGDTTNDTTGDTEAFACE
jgi:hypothetical protein